MSLTIILDNQPEFYTNLDTISGRVRLTLTRPENITAIAVKLEGESTTIEPSDINGPTGFGGGGSFGGSGSFGGGSFGGGGGGGSFAMPGAWSPGPLQRLGPPGAGRVVPAEVTEGHKIVYKVWQAFPENGAAAASPRPGPHLFPPGSHEYGFSFQVPVNNGCADRREMARTGGMSGSGVYGPSGQSLLGLVVGGGIRVMDGSRQLMLQHVRQTLPPSLTGSRRAEIRYYVKATVQRVGILRENFRASVGFKFMPIEPPRPPPTSAEVYARRPFSFSPAPVEGSRRSISSSLFEGFRSRSTAAAAAASAATDDPNSLPPTIIVAARLPHPPILTCHRPIPLRLLATKKSQSRAEVYLTSLQIELVGETRIRCIQQRHVESRSCVVMSRTGLNIPLTRGPDAAVDSELELDDALWRQIPLPSSVTPSFTACNIQRSYVLEVKLGVSWAWPSKSPKSQQEHSQHYQHHHPAQPQQTLFLPLTFKNVSVYSGIVAPPPLMATAQPPAQTVPRQTGPPPSSEKTGVSATPQRHQPTSPTVGSGGGGMPPPALPPRPRSSSVPTTPTGAAPPPGQNQPLGPDEPLYEDAPPSYDEVMAETLVGPFDGIGRGERPAFSGITDENGPSGIPEKR